MTADLPRIYGGANTLHPAITTGTLNAPTGLVARIDLCLPDIDRPDTNR